MNTARLGILTVIAAVLVALTSWWHGSSPTAREVGDQSAVPVVGSPSAMSSTWFCPSGGTGTDKVAQHLLRLTNQSDDVTQVRLTAFSAKGEAGQKNLSVAAGKVQTFDVGAEFKAADLSVMAEADSGNLAVEHGLVLADRAEVVPCSNRVSRNWYFPSQSSVDGAAPRLVLFNPFSADASVVVSGAVADGARVPSDWNGIVVPSGTSRVINLAEEFQIRDQFSVSVRVKLGQVVAETVQTLDLPAGERSAAVRGIRIQPGIAEASEAWTFAGGFRDAGATERVIVQNPGSDSTSVSVQVVPFGAGDMPPEPFDLEVPAGRYAVLDLTGEGRIPDVGFHSILVQSSPGHPVVAVRTISLSAAPPGAATDKAPTRDIPTTRLSFATGASVSVGSTVSSRVWIIPAVTTGPGNEPVAFIHNAGSGIAKVSVESRADGGPAVDVVKDSEVASGDGLAVDLSPEKLDVQTVRYYIVRASEPVTVDSLVTFTSAQDFSLGSALSLRG